ncbi:MAG: hypothetical protein HOP03_17890 [Lysobacter sp.]|nr:hypothetical protein [Lysobacter sp.]
MNKQEKFAWIRFGGTALVFAFLCWKLFFADAPVGADGWEAIKNNVVNLFYVLIFAGAVLTSPRKGVVADEHDRAISASAARTALVALTLIVTVSATIVGMDPYADLLAMRSTAWFEHYLLACLALAWWVESSVCVFHHWRDRR